MTRMELETSGKTYCFTGAGAALVTILTAWLREMWFWLTKSAIVPVVLAVAGEVPCTSQVWPFHCTKLVPGAMTDVPAGSLAYEANCVALLSLAVAVIGPLTVCVEAVTEMTPGYMAG